jgi:predicted dehydrogenase
MGMVGGGPGAFIGEVHRKAARMDGGIELVAGAFDINPRKSKQMGREQGIDPKRAYPDYETMIEKESELPEDQRIDFVSVTVPNNWHFPIAKGFLEAGFYVMCEKPMTKLARDMVTPGDLGKILKIVVQYPQGWLIRPIEREGQQQASWRTDPKQSGAAGCMGDIGTHACHLAEYISGLKVQQICADLTTFVKGRRLDDDGNCLLRFNKGAKGILHASQVSIGEENNLAIWVYGEDASIEWHQEHPNYLYVNRIDAPQEVWKRGNDYVAEKSPAAGRATRLPFGHPEAFLEAFANNYCNFADTIRAKLERKKADPLFLDFPGVKDGVRGMKFIQAVVKSSDKGAKWVNI